MEDKKSADNKVNENYLQIICLEIAKKTNKKEPKLSFLHCSKEKNE